MMKDEILVMIKYDSHKIFPEAGYCAFVNDPNCPNDAPEEREIMCRGWIRY